MASKIYQEPRKLKICVASFFALLNNSSLSLNKQAAKAKKQKKVAKKLHFIFAKEERTRYTLLVSV